MLYHGLPAALREELKCWLEQLKTDEARAPERYHDSGMLLRLPNGQAVESVLIRKKFLKWQDAHPEFPRIVFHGLRHSSATYQLLQSGGNFKAVQGNTGHATAGMLMDTYAHTQDKPRLELAEKIEANFYKDASSRTDPAPAGGENLTVDGLLDLVRRMAPEQRREFARLLFA